jgi:hypothetical protein
MTGNLGNSVGSILGQNSVHITEISHHVGSSEMFEERRQIRDGGTGRTLG